MTDQRIPDDFEREVRAAFRRRLSALDSVEPSRSTKLAGLPAAPEAGLRVRVRSGRAARLSGAAIGLVVVLLVGAALIGSGRWSASSGATAVGVSASATATSPVSTASAPPTPSSAVGSQSVASIPVQVPTPSPFPWPTQGGPGWAGLSATGAIVDQGDMTLIFSWPGGLLARGPNSADMKYSADGRTWRDVGGAPAFDYEHDLMDGLAWTGGRIVATGWRGAEPMVWASPDGASWSALDTGGTFAPSGPLVGLAANPNGVVGATADGQVWRSTDGRSWSSFRLAAADQRVTQVIASSSRFVIVAANGGNGGAIPNQGVTTWSSSDGVAWRSAVPTRGQWTAVQLFVIDDGFVAYEKGAVPNSVVVGEGALAAWRSSDGFDWQTMIVPPSGYEVVGSNGAILVAEQLVDLLMGDLQPLVQSLDGEHWTPLPVTGSRWSGEASAVVPGGIFVHLDQPLDPYEFYVATPASP
jgi:hypothetical protein